MQEITDPSSCVTSNPAPECAQHTVISTLRSVGVPTEPLRPSLARDINYTTGDRYERHASWDAFGADLAGSAA